MQLIKVNGNKNKTCFKDNEKLLKFGILFSSALLFTWKLVRKKEKNRILDNFCNSFESEKDKERFI